MPIKRRGFVRGLILAPAAQAALSAQQTSTPPSTPPPGRGGFQQPDVPKLKVTGSEVAADPYPHFLSADQFATLQKLGSVLMPPMKGNPGALDAKAPEFLDFLISVSPADRQELYRNGLDHMNAEARKIDRKSFAQLDAKQADEILRPLLVVRPWAEDMPADPIQRFVAQVHEDLRTATMNSREWAEAAAKSGRRFQRGARGSGYYWKPIDPVD
jgi:Gluconate 2-dehydrogenase subunit 3